MNSDNRHGPWYSHRAVTIKDTESSIAGCGIILFALGLAWALGIDPTSFFTSAEDRSIHQGPNSVVVDQMTINHNYAATNPRADDPVTPLPTPSPPVVQNAPTLPVPIQLPSTANSASVPQAVAVPIVVAPRYWKHDEASENPTEPTMPEIKVPQRLSHSVGVRSPDRLDRRSEDLEGYSSQSPPIYRPLICDEWGYTGGFDRPEICSTVPQYSGELKFRQREQGYQTQPNQPTADVIRCSLRNCMSDEIRQR